MNVCLAVVTFGRIELEIPGSRPQTVLAYNTGLCIVVPALESHYIDEIQMKLYGNNAPLLNPKSSNI